MNRPVVLSLQCPHAPPPDADAARKSRDDRKSVEAAAGPRLIQKAQRVDRFNDARAILRDGEARQAGFLAGLVGRFNRMRPPILFLSGEAHRRQRKATARFFAPKIVAGRYRDLMIAETDLLVERLRRDGAADLDALALELAVAVAGEIVGLTESHRGDMARRLDSFAASGGLSGNRVSMVIQMLVRQWRVQSFFRHDVRPAIVARRRHPRDDVISHLVAEGYSGQEILTECVTYGAAGMITTREFITMAGWHLLTTPTLRDHFLSSDEPERIALLEEILRLEPVVGTLYRRLPGKVEPIAIDVRASNSDGAVVGACPHDIEVGRAIPSKVGGAVMSFGDGEHRCPGAQVALHESAIFLTALLRVPGIALEREPQIGWNPLVTGYELRGARLICERTSA